MFLKSLTISGNEGVIREISFQAGVNLIVDNSPGEDESGNNVGKTTVLRLIDYCLAGKGSSLLQDAEFGGDSRLKDFLIEKEVLLTLVLTKDISRSTAPKITIERNFLARSESILRIDGEKFSKSGKKSFSAELARRFFDYEEEKPTFRQLIAKNVRIDQESMEYILKVLGSFGKNLEYEALYKFWLGIDSTDASDHQNLNTQFKKQESYHKKLSTQFDIGAFSTIDELTSEIEKLEDQKDALDFDEHFQEKLTKFDQFKAEMSQIGTQLSAVELRKSLIQKSQERLEKDLSTVSGDEVRRLYENAKILLPQLQKTFEESLQFHNQMVENKLAFITEELPELEEKERKLRSSLLTLENEAEVLREIFQKDDTTKVLTELTQKLFDLKDRFSRLTEQRALWKQSQKDLERLEKKLTSLTKFHGNQTEKIDAKLHSLNQSLNEFSEKLYGQRNKLIRREFGKNGESLETLQLEMRGVLDNPGTGEKKGQITAFDLAYIDFAEREGIPHLNFILHDQIETIDGRKITKILLGLVPTVNCQYIAPILRDKIPDEIEADSHCVIELSQTEKLFRF